MEEPRFDWPGLMRAGMRGLGLRPAEFWALTPAELQFLLGPEKALAPMGRARLSELLAAYPDKDPDKDPDAGSKRDKGESDG